MSEAIEKIANLITEAQAPATPAPKLYPLDQNLIDVPITAPGNLILWHRLELPSLEDLIQREQQSVYETEEVTKTESRLLYVDDSPDGILWNKTASHVKGYSLADIKPDEWTMVTPALGVQIPAEHKSAAIRGFYKSRFEIKREKGEGFALGATTHTILQTIGQYVIQHILRLPIESERRQFRRSAAETRFATGAQKLRTKILTHFEAYTNTYDSLYQKLEGVTLSEGAGEISDLSPAQVKAMVNPIWKRGVIDCLMGEFEVALSD